MPITTTEYADFTDKAFFNQREWLNQENWQMYFGGSLPSGVLVKGKLESSGVDYTSALSRQVLSQSYIQFRAGSVLANGIFASYAGGNSIPTIKSGDVDRLFVVRVFVTAGNVKIVGMTKVAAEYGYTPNVFAKMLLQDESLACTRNNTYYDIPLLYEVFGGDVYDLRRLIYIPGQYPDIDITYLHDEVANTDTIPGVLYGRDFVQVYGGMNYNVTFAAADTSTSFYVYPNPSCSEKHTVVKLTNSSAVEKQIRIPLLFKSLPFAYSWLESWDADPNNRYLYKELVAGDKMTLVFTPNGHSNAFEYTVTNKSSASGGGGGVDPEDYFTKQEIAAQMLLKANVTDMNDALALKEDKASLGTLAYQNAADYITQVINKPTLGILASKDQANLSTDATGILPIANGGTGANTLAGIIANAVGSERIFYVDNVNGNDNNDGLSYENAFRTVQYAVDTCPFISTCTLFLESGTYNESITIPRGKYIRIMSYRTDVTITFAPSNNNKAINVDGGELVFYPAHMDNHYGIAISSSSYQLTISGYYNGGMVEVNHGGSLSFGIPTTIINTYNEEFGNTSKCLYITGNSYVQSDQSLSLNETGSRKYISLYVDCSRAIFKELSVLGWRGIVCYASIINIKTTYTANTESYSISCLEGSIVTYDTLSGSSSREQKEGGRIYSGNAN